MKQRSIVQSARIEIFSVLLGVFLCSVSAHASTNWLYDLYLTPSTLPSAPFTTFVNGSGGDQQIASGALLTLVDTNDSTTGYFYSDTLNSSIINSGLDYEARSRVR